LGIRCVGDLNRILESLNIWGRKKAGLNKHPLTNSVRGIQHEFSYNQVLATLTVRSIRSRLLPQYLSASKIQINRLCRDADDTPVKATVEHPKLIARLP
jgi:hypothetical protein